MQNPKNRTAGLKKQETRGKKAKAHPRALSRDKARWLRKAHGRAFARLGIEPPASRVGAVPMLPGPHTLCGPWDVGGSESGRGGYIPLVEGAGFGFLVEDRWGIKNKELGCESRMEIKLY